MSNPPFDEESIFDLARMIDAPAARSAYLEQACGSNAELKERVQALLEVHDQRSDFLESPPSGVGETLDLPKLEERPGTVVGRYKLMEQIGEGGMGVVYMAEQQQPVRRRVALKIIKPGMDTRQVVARFEAERQALAMMDHPNIARVLDGGSTDSGRPYFVMELVRGVSVTEYCDQTKLDTTARLKIFRSICQAVQHAHTKGIIHRDLKPSNVLVTLHDGVPVPMIIDFGVSKAMGQQLTEKTMFTAFAQMVGTPLYMSPEQAEMSGLDIDTRSDIYSLGVLLYELLTGVTPFDRKRMHTAAFDELRRIIREEEPAKPSTRVSSLGESSATVSAQRSTNPAKLKQLLRGELDWIVMKTLEKDRTRRYETANALVAEVDRYLNGEPVNACPPSTTYRLSKFARRYRSQVVVASAFVLMSLASSVIAWVLFAKARRAEELAVNKTNETIIALRQAEDAKDEIQYQRDRAEKNFQLSQQQKLRIERQAAEQRRRLYDYNLVKAATALEKEDTRRAAGLLADCLEEQRGWEWHRLDRLLPSRRTLRLTAPYVRAAVSPTEQRFVVVDNDGVFRICSLETGDEIISGATGVNSPRSVLFSPSGKFIAVLGYSPTAGEGIEVWDGKTGQRKWESSANGVITHASFSPDERHISFGTSTVSGGRNRLAGVTYVYDMDLDKTVWRRETEGRIPFPVFGPKGRRLYITETSGPPGSGSVASLVCCSIEGNADPIWSCPTQTSLACPTPDGARLIIGGTNHTLLVLDATNGNPIEEVPGTYRGTPYRSALSADGEHHISLGHLGRIIVRDWRTKRVVQSFELSTSVDVYSETNFANNGEQIVVPVHDEQAIELREVVLAPSTLELSGHDQLTSVAFSPDGKQVTSAFRDGTLKRWSTETGQEVQTFTAHQNCYAVGYSPDGALVATGGDDGIKLWSTDSGELKRHCDDSQAGWLDFSPNGERIICASGPWSGKRTLSLFEVVDGRRILTRETPRSINGVAFCADGRRAVTVMHLTGQLDVWDLSTGDTETIRPGREDGNHARCLVRHPQENLVALVANGATELWDVDQKQLVTTLQTSGAPPYCVTFSHDGTRLFVGDEEGLIMVWNLDTEERLLTIDAHEQEYDVREGLLGVKSVAISPDGRTLATAGADRLIKLLETTRPTPQLELRRRTVREATRIVSDLYSHSSSQRQVITSLMADTSLAQDVLRVAVDIANARGDVPFLKPPKLDLHRTLNEIERHLESNPKLAMRLFVKLVEGEAGFRVDVRQADMLPYDRANDWHSVAAKLGSISVASEEGFESSLTELIAAHPHAHHFHYIRGHSRARRGMWREAEQDLTAALARLPANSPGWHRLACSLGPLYLYLEDTEKYQRLYQTMLADFGSNENKYLAERTVKLCTLSSLENVQLDRVAALADDKLTLAAIERSGNTGWMLLSKAMAEYRFEKWNASKALLKSIERKYERQDEAYSAEHQNLLAMTYCFRSMCLQKLDDHAAASDALKLAERIINSEGFPQRGGDVDQPFWHDWISVQIAHDEARRNLGVTAQ